jgi:hypothetical protein
MHFDSAGAWGHIRARMKTITIVTKILAALALLSIIASPAGATTFTYKLLGYAYDDFTAAPIQARDGPIYAAGQNPSTDYGLSRDSADQLAPVGSQLAVGADCF